ncbi:DUF7742 family protein [Ruegeria atlantica]|uniref:DUF7742 domain-containing protein n=1 Tax=Ruegeria atlantica TaxID=81569 RepID=A0A0P1EDM4_9RHOB|nr:hypothetical protein [Ruegeria atlantica]CUH47898.1 hypothetical protein RUA4292_02074 [Ruegeria atlantica]
MRPVLHGDVSAAARVLLNAPPSDRERLCTRMINEAELADIYVGHTGRLHPLFGNGSLMTVARTRPLANEPSFDDLKYCQCFEMVLRCLVQFRVTRMRS